MNLPIIREVSNPAAPAIAFDEDGKTVVEVDENLSGRARALAIMVALRAHDRGKDSLILIPLLVYAWDPLTRWVRHNPASAVATAGVATVVGATTFIPWLTGDEQPLSAANPVATLIVTAAPATPTSVRLTPSPEPTRTASANPTREPPLNPTSKPAALHTTPPTRLPSSSPTAATQTPRPSGTRLPTRHPTPTSTRTAPPSTPPPAGTTPKSPTPTAAPSPTGQPAVSPTPQPTPTTAAAADQCLLEVELDPLLNVCVLG